MSPLSHHPILLLQLSVSSQQAMLFQKLLQEMEQAVVVAVEEKGDAGQSQAPGTGGMAAAAAPHCQQRHRTPPLPPLE